MAHNSTLVQSGTDFYLVAEDGASAVLSEPSTVTISSTRPPRFEVNGVHAVVVNSVTEPLIVDDSGIVLFMSPAAPSTAPTVAVGTAGALTGTFGVKYTFAIRTIDDVLVAESGFSPSASVALTSDKLDVSALETLTGLTAANYNARYEVVRRVYRTTAGTSTYFLWYTVADNTTTTFEDDTADSGINTLAAASLSSAPFLSNVAGFRDRLFGVDDVTNREILLYSEAGLRWAWPDDNTFTMPQMKGDSQSGITALMPRRDALGVAKSNMLLQLTGTSDADFQLVTLSTSIGCVSQESAALYRDAWYFLGQDGVYRWDENGVNSITDGRVRSWFTTDDYFDRDSFEDAFGVIDILDKTYKLFLIEAGDTDSNVWIEYDIESGTWWGPHKSDAYTFTSAFTTAGHQPLMAAGTSDGYLAVETSDRLDAATDAIEVEAITAPIQASDPPTMTYFGNLDVEVEPQDAGALLIYPTVGELSEGEGTVLIRDLTDPGESLARLGYGRFLKLRFYHNTINQVIQILGFEVSPVSVVGRRE